MDLGGGLDCRGGLGCLGRSVWRHGMTCQERGFVYADADMVTWSHVSIL